MVLEVDLMGWDGMDLRVQIQNNHNKRRPLVQIFISIPAVITQIEEASFEF